MKYDSNVLGRVKESIHESIKCQCKNSVLTVFRVTLCILAVCCVYKTVIFINGWHLRLLTKTRFENLPKFSDGQFLLQVSIFNGMVMTAIIVISGNGCHPKWL